MESTASLWALFASAFVSATLLPGGSEIALGALVVERHHLPWVLITTATAGNTLGGMTTYLLGYLVAAGFPKERLARPGYRRALDWLQRWGPPTLLLSWLPLVGDPLCWLAGWLRMRPAIAVFFIAAGKLARYWVIVRLVSA